MQSSKKPSHRADQVGHVIRDAVARLLPRYFRTERYGLLTVTEVTVAPKFDSAKVFVSCFRNSHQFEEEAATHVYAIQQEINHTLAMKKVPKLLFRLDQTARLTARLDELLK